MEVNPHLETMVHPSGFVFAAGDLAG